MITTKKIKELNFSDQVYYIPSYQRGYRWDDKQVTDLLDDLYEVFVTKQESYCLQPLVVSTIEDNRFEIIDGQQRLTTIFILLTRFSKFINEKFQLDYEIRTDCAGFLQNLENEILNYSNADYAHISNAYKKVNSWLAEKIEKRVDSNIEMNIFQTLLEKVEIIWYDIEEKDRTERIKIFTRLNSGKIPLTNAELIKALFLSKANFGNTSDDIYTKQLDISNKWNQIEYSLQDEEFWNFIIPSELNIPTRIDYLLQLIVRNKGNEIKEEWDVFRYYYPFYVDAQQNKKYDFVDSNWKDLELYFTLLQDWYNHNTYYHLIGLLIWDGVDILELLKVYQESDKKSFVTYLFKEIEERFCGFDFGALDYKKSYRDVERVLVFFNVIESYHRAIHRFPFKRLKDEAVKWTLEHIHPQNALEIKQSEYAQWLKDHLEIILHLNDDNQYGELIESVEKLIAELKNSKNKKEFKLLFETLSSQVLQIFEFKEGGNNLISPKSKIAFEILGGEHHLSNMALLDSKRNTSLGNSAFGVKRKAIIDFELNGVFIPLATKNSFLKYYSDFPKHLNYWTLEDRDEYLFKIQERINYVKNYKPDNNEC